MKVLVADDDPAIVEALLGVLQDGGHDATGVHDGFAALAAARAGLPDVALLDITMPGMSGYDVAREIRGTSSGRPMLIAISASGSASDRMLAAIAGFDHHLSKPFGARAIVRLITSLNLAATSG